MTTKKTPMTPQAATRIQSATAQKGNVSKGRFAAKAQSAATKNSGNGKRGK